MGRMKVDQDGVEYFDPNDVGPDQRIDADFWQKRARKAEALLAAQRSADVRRQRRIRRRRAALSGLAS